MNVLVPLIISFYVLLHVSEIIDRKLHFSKWLFLPFIAVGYLVFIIFVFYLFNM